MSIYHKIIVVLLIIVICISIMLNYIYYSNVNKNIIDTNKIKMELENVKTWQDNIEKNGINIR